MSDGAPGGRDISIWWWAFGYFASYVPFGALPKAVSEGALPGMTGRVDGFVRLLLSRRPVRGRAWVALGLSFASLAGGLPRPGARSPSPPRRSCASRSIPARTSSASG